MTDTSLFRPNPNVVATELDDDEAVLLDLESRRYYTLNDTGTRVWQLVNAGRSVPEVAHALTEEWDVEQEAAEDYVRSFMQELVEEGLVEHFDG